MYASLNERRAFERRRRSLFRKGYDIQRLFQARVYIVIERHGFYYAYRPSQRSGNWPPDKDAAEIRDAETLFPTDFQTVREADMRGPVASSDTEDTPSYRAPSRDESVPNRLAEADEVRYRNLSEEADACPNGYGRPQEQNHLYRSQADASSFGNTTTSAHPAEAYDTPMSELGALDDQVMDLHRDDEDVEEQKPLLDMNSSPRTDNTGYASAGAEMAEFTAHGIRRDQPTGRPVRSNSNGRVPPHVKSQELLQSMYPSFLTQPNGITMDAGRSQANERTASQSHQQRWLSSHSAPNVDDGCSLQVPEERTPKRLAHTCAADGPRHAGSRGQTPDMSPKRTPHSGRKTSTGTSSADRRKSSPALNSLPKVPTRRQPKRRV